MDQLIEVGIFSGKALVITLSIIVVLITVASLALKAKQQREHLEVEHLNGRFESYQKLLKSHILSKKEFKTEKKSKKKEHKKKSKTPQRDKKRLFIIEFEGDMRASQVSNLREEVTAVLSVANPDDEVMVVVESPGGMVHAYGLAAAQLARFREHKIHLTICVDKIAASGGYMMACTADKILAAPFAVVGSIGVIAQVPNFNKLLKKHNIDYEEITAGEFKRTISMLGEITEKGRQKFLEQIEDTHGLFKAFIKEFRPSIDIDRVATGEHWLARQAIDLNLVDKLMTSDEFILGKKDDREIYKITLQSKRKLGQILSEAVGDSSVKVMEKAWNLFQNKTIG